MNIMVKKLFSCLLAALLLMSLFAVQNFAQDNEMPPLETNAVDAETKVDLHEAEGNPEISKSEELVRHRWFEETIIQMDAEGKSETEVKAYLKQNGIGVVEPSSQSDAGASPLSEAENVIMNRPSIYWDNILRQYIIQGSMVWKANSSGDKYWHFDTDMFPDLVGGTDGIGIELGANSYCQLQDYSLATVDSEGDDVYTYNAEDHDPNRGVVFKIQDRTWWNSNGTAIDYTLDKYYIYSYWTVSQPVTNLSVSHRYGHTWVSTGCTPTIGSAGISFSFTSLSNGWTTVSDPYYWSS
jgi:hypothetical protein